MKSAVVLVSGRGSNLRALVEARTGVGIARVISNRPGAGALEFARGAGLATEVLDHTAYATREAFDGRLADSIEASGAELVLLAGFFRR